MKKRAESTYKIRAVTNALHLLEALRGEAPRGISELSRELDLQKNNVFRLLVTLAAEGYVEQAELDHRYRLGPACLRLGRFFSESHRLRALARPLLAELAAELGETVHLGVRRDSQVLHLDGQPGRGLVVTAQRVGLELPCHCTALGKVLLAWAPSEIPEERDLPWLAPGELTRRTPGTVVDREKLVEQLGSVRVRGFALDLEECEVGLACVAAPVFGSGGDPLGALSVSAPAFRLSSEAIEHAIAPALLQTASRLSRSLGYSA